MSNQLILVIVLAVVVFFGLGVVALGALGAIGVSSSRKYVEHAKTSEGRVGVMMLARGMIDCASSERVEAVGAAATGLPATSKSVPGSLAEVAAKRYLSSPADWNDPAFRCAHFSMTEPQYFQYQWVSSGPRAGVARAVADLNGDGTPDSVLEVDVACGEGGADCKAGPVREVR